MGANSIHLSEDSFNLNIDPAMDRPCLKTIAGALRHWLLGSGSPRNQKKMLGNKHIEREQENGRKIRKIKLSMNETETKYST